MEVILADYLGFCYGVKRAISLARESAGKGSASTLGPIIHNPQMVERLAAEGVGTVDTLSDIPDGGTVIIRSHGVGPDVYAEAKERALSIVDATCPHVKKAQMAASELARAGYDVVIVGEKKHPEVRSIFDWTDGKATVIETEEEADDVPRRAKLGIVAQTTFSGGKFQKIASRLLGKANDIRILRTICTATEQRQAAAIDLAARVDLMVVIGGKNSANTTRLAELCATKTRTCHIETASELHDDLLDNINKIGITAGASTPDWIIREVYEKCKSRTWGNSWREKPSRKSRSTRS